MPVTRERTLENRLGAFEQGETDLLGEELDEPASLGHGKERLGLAGGDCNGHRAGPRGLARAREELRHLAREM